MIDYATLIAAKKATFEPRGLAHAPALNSHLFPYQAAATEFLLRQGCGAAFLDTGLGKSLISLDWGRVVVEHSNRPVLMLAPLAVAQQHEREAAKFGIDARSIREPSEVRDARVYVTNYDRLGRFDPSAFSGVILDESSILKSFTGATTRALIRSFAATPFRLACTATPAPNDHMEIGQHSAFLGVMDAPEMLSRWFLSDQTEMGRYRLKRPAVKSFWEWVSSWARCASKPSDLGFTNDGFDMPRLDIKRHVVRADLSLESGEDDGQFRLFRSPQSSATSIHREKRLTCEARAAAVAEIVEAEPDEAWVIWVETNEEADAICARLPGAVEVRGSMPSDKKEERIVGFSTGQIKWLVSKPSITGFGLNWQHCARTAFMSLSYSYESYYQAIRRFWRFGQSRPVEAHIVLAETEMRLWDVIQRKADDHQSMKAEMCAAMARAMRTSSVLDDYRPTRNVSLPEWLRSAA